MTNTNKSGIFQALKEAPQKIINYILGAVSRIFSPRDDNYPETGTQPFEGEPGDKKIINLEFTSQNKNPK